MAKSRKARVFTKTQEIYDRPRKVLIGRYLTPKGNRLLNEGTITEHEAYHKYGKNQYVIDPDAKVIKVITHPNNHRRLR